MTSKKGEKTESGTLFVVATPIGNLKDITYRAVETLRGVDAIVAEDSRHSRRLLEHYDIDTPFTLSYYQGAGEERREELIAKLREGTNLALISDAGTPLVSDPGFKLVREARERQLKVVGIPGPTAAITCLSISGQPSDSFVFDGQVPKKSGKKRKYFEKLRTRKETTLFYDSPHRIEKTLEIMADTLPERSITLCRELTKKFESTRRGKPEEILKGLREEEIRGEFTLAIRGATDEEIAAAKREEFKDVPLEQQYEGLKKLKGLSRKEAMKELAELRGLSRNEVYDELNK